MGEGVGNQDLSARQGDVLKALSCPLSSTPINATWHVRDAAITDNDSNCPDRSKDPCKNLEDNDMPDTGQCTGEGAAGAFESLTSFTETQPHHTTQSPLHPCEF